ncbi:hypothetical protein HYH03_015333 [Edaphochlamys debaryana]|uniref:Uncharacterized protein n=1 Tax=Edaphochlamys debaryana TaxID=47281 RepID=A0A835XSA5_9CHLO|nr:hypothetical protein HYH03_015333 [Edaphochlamys debaryana]|eukprot:KAG2486020.1 hypothetical protein HYH03_015333 [Edaphochlamys debaryana]
MAAADQEATVATGFTDVLANLDAVAWRTLTASIRNQGSLGLWSVRRACKALRDGIDSNITVVKPKLDTGSIALLASGEWTKIWPHCREAELVWPVPEHKSLLPRDPFGFIPSVVSWDGGPTLASFLASPLESRSRFTSLQVVLETATGCPPRQPLPYTAVSRLLAALPELRSVELEAGPGSLTLTGNGSVLLQHPEQGVGQLTGSSQLTRLVVTHNSELSRMNYDPDDEDEGDDDDDDEAPAPMLNPCAVPPCPYVHTALCEALPYLGSLQELRLDAYTDELILSGVRSLLDALPPSLRLLSLAGAHVGVSTGSPGVTLTLDSAASSLTLELGATAELGSLGRFATDALLSSRVSAAGGPRLDRLIIASALDGQAAVRLGAGSTMCLASFERFTQRFEVVEVDRIQISDASPQQVAAVAEALGVPRWLSLREHTVALRLSDGAPASASASAPAPAGPGGAGSSVGGDEAEAAAAVATPAERFLECLPVQEPSAWTSPFWGSDKALLLLRGPAVTRLVTGSGGAERLAAAVQRMEEEAEAAAGAGAGGGSGGGGKGSAAPLFAPVGGPFGASSGAQITAYAAVPSTDALLVECGSGEARERVAAAAAGVLGAAAAAGDGAGADASDVRVTRTEGKLRYEDRLVNVSDTALRQVLQAAWDGSSPALSRLERFRALTELWQRLSDHCAAGECWDGGPTLASFLASPLESRTRFTSLRVVLGIATGRSAHHLLPYAAVSRLLAALPELRSVELEAGPRVITPSEAKTLFAALATLPHLSSLVLTGNGSVLLQHPEQGVGQLTGSTQLTRLVVTHNSAFSQLDEHPNADAYDMDEAPFRAVHAAPFCPYNHTALCEALPYLGSLQALRLDACTQVLDIFGVRSLLDVLPPSLRYLHLPVAHVGFNSASPNVTLTLDYYASSLTLALGSTAKLGKIAYLTDVSRFATEALLSSQHFMYGEARLARLVYVSAVEGQAAVRLGGGCTADLPGLRRLRELFDAAEVDRVQFSEPCPEPDQVAAVAGVLGVPRWLSLREHTVALRLSDGAPASASASAPAPAGPGGAGSSVGGDEAEAAAVAATPAERFLECLPVQEPSAWTSPFWGSDKALLVLRGPAITGLVAEGGNGGALAEAAKRMEEEAKAAAGTGGGGGRGAPAPLFAPVGGGLLGAHITAYAPVPSTDALLVECGSGEARERVAAAAAGVLGAAAAAGEVRVTRTEGKLRYEDRLVNVSHTALHQVLQAAWDGSSPALSRLERFRDVTELWQRLSDVRLEPVRPPWCPHYMALVS